MPPTARKEAFLNVPSSLLNLLEVFKKKQLNKGAPSYRMSNSASNGNGRTRIAEHGLYEILEAAESALCIKKEEVEHLRSALRDTQQELQMTKAELSAKSNGYHKDDGRNVVGGAQLFLSPPPVSPNRHADAGADALDAKENGSKRQDMMLTTTRTPEEECYQLRNCLLDASLKEAQMINDITMLQRRVSELRLAYDQQQQGLADAASKALSYRQDILEENIRLTYELHVAEQERTVFVSSLLPLLAEFGLQPPSPDAHSVVGAVKALIQHLRSRLNINETKLKESRRPTWQLYAPPSPYNIGSPTRTSQQPMSPQSGQGLEIVSQQTYSQPQRTDSPSSPTTLLSVTDRELPFPLHPDLQFDTQTSASNDGDDSDGAVAKAFVPEKNDPAKRSSHLPSLPEEPNNHSVSEDDDPLPAVVNLRIVGDAVLGSKLTVCGQMINGTTLCIFQWIRQPPELVLHDVIYGASGIEYTISADDVDTAIGIQCSPMDDRRRQGEKVTEFANGHNPIRCDASVEDQIYRHLTAGHVQFEVTLSEDGSWEPGILMLKRSGYEIRVNNVRRVHEKYSEDINVGVLLGPLKQCLITSSDGKEHILSFRENRMRDEAVLTLRRFRQAALDGKKKKNQRKGASSWFAKK